MMSDSGSTRSPLVDTMRRLIDGLLAAAEGRLQLLVVEYTLEKYRLLDLLLLAAMAAFFGIMTVIFFAVALLLLVPLDYRLHVVAAVCLISALVALAAAFRLRSRLKSPPPFGETIAQLKKDREWFTTRK